MFLDEKNTNYLKELINELIRNNYNKFLKLSNTEIPNSILNKKASQADIILKNDNNEYIIEMNYTYSKLLYFKNYYYLFKEHTKRSYRKNNYGLNNNTILINIDNYDYLKRKRLIYEVNLKDNKYNTVMYNNIKCIHINLEYLRDKYYNKCDNLNKLEKLLLIFIEQRKDKLLNICKNKCVKELIEYMDYLKIGNDFITVYDKEEFDNAVREEVEQEKENIVKEKQNIAIEKEKIFKEKKDVQKEKQDVQKEKKDVQKEKQDIQKEKYDIAMEKQNIAMEKQNITMEKQNITMEKQNLEKNKIEIAKELKLLGLPIEKIIKLTKLNIKDITLL